MVKRMDRSKQIFLEQDPMIRSYRIHQEQIKKVEQSLKAPYLIHKAESCMHETSNRAGTQIKRPEHTAVTRPMQRQKFPGPCWKTSDRESDDKRELRLFPPPLPAIRCIRCRACMPMMDFLYTKKTGLCIPCWEEQEV